MSGVFPVMQTPLPAFLLAFDSPPSPSFGPWTEQPGNQATLAIPLFNLYPPQQLDKGLWRKRFLLQFPRWKKGGRSVLIPFPPFFLTWRSNTFSFLHTLLRLCGFLFFKDTFRRGKCCTVVLSLIFMLQASVVYAKLISSFARLTSKQSVCSFSSSVYFWLEIGKK